MRFTVVALVPIALLFAACGPAGELAPADQSRKLAISPADVTTEIVGATPKQETILREILAGLGRDTRIRSVHVIPDGKDGQSVAVDPHVAPGEAVRREWEIWLLANAFASRSRATGLQRVTMLFIDGELDSSLDGGDPIEPRDPVSAEALSREVLAGAKKSHARLVQLELLHPDNDAVYVKLQVDDPASFLDHRAGTFFATVQTPHAARYDGLFVEVVDGKSRLAWSHSLAVSEDGGGSSWGFNRPELAGCDPIPSIGGSPFSKPPPPCPSGKPEAQVETVAPWDGSTRIVEATPKQETVLREILSGLGENVIEEIRVAPAGREWTPFHPHSVVVRLKTAKNDEKERANWEAALVAEAFEARSRALHLQPVAGYETANDGVALDGPDEPDPDDRAPVTRNEIESGIARGANESGAEIVTLRIVEPRHLAAAITLRVGDPASFLKHRLRTFLEAVPSPSNRQYDGFYVLVTDRNGKYVWLSAMTVGETVSGGTQGARADLAGCYPSPMSGSATGDEPPTCPVD